MRISHSCSTNSEKKSEAPKASWKSVANDCSRVTASTITNDVENNDDE